MLPAGRVYSAKFSSVDECDSQNTQLSYDEDATSWGAQTAES